MGAQLSRGKSQEEVYRYREAELTHGRIGMLASAGFLVQEGYHPLFEGTGETYSQQLQDVPGWFWLPLVLVFGAIEVKRASRSKDLSEGYYPGDFGWDPLGLKPDDAEEFQRKQEIELNNGRLGMIASLGFIAQEAATGASWRDFWTPGVMTISPLHADTQSSDVPAVMLFGGKKRKRKSQMIARFATVCQAQCYPLVSGTHPDSAAASRRKKYTSYAKLSLPMAALACSPPPASLFRSVV